MKGNGGSGHGRSKNLPAGKPFWAAMLVLAAVAAAVFLFLQNRQPQAPDVDDDTVYFADGREVASYINTVDGDTAWFEISGKRYKVRFLGVDAPEINTEDGKPEPYGEQSARLVADVLENAMKIVLESDPLSDTYDKYGRLLCWVWADGELLNAKLVAEGLAEVGYIYDDYMYVDELYQMQDSAKKEGAGMWR